MDTEKLWTKNFLLISSINFLTHIIFYLLMSTIVMYAIEQFHTNQSSAGLVSGVFVLASLIGRIFSAKFLNHFGGKKTLVISLVVFSISMISHLFAMSLLILFILRFIQGVTHGLITTTGSAIVAESIPTSRMGEGIGYYTTAMNIAMAIGPFIGIFLSHHTSFQVIIIVGGIVSIMDLIAGLLIHVQEKDLSENKAEKAGTYHVLNFIEPTALPISMTIFAIALGYSSLLSYISVYTKEIDLVNAGTFYFIAYAVVLILTRPVTGKWFDKYGENIMTYPLLIILAAGFLLLSYANTGFVLLLSAALIGIGYGTVLSNFQAIAIKVSPKNKKALATSTFFIFLDLGVGIGPYLLGKILEMVQFRQLFFLLSMWIVITMGIYYMAHGKKSFKRLEE